MFSIGGGTNVFLTTGVTDLRRGFDGLHDLIAHEHGADPLDGSFYVFGNRRRDLVKIFYFDTGGMCIFSKRLETSSFRWPQAGEKFVTMTLAQLQLLLSGIDLTKTKTRKWWRPADASSATPAKPKPAKR